MSIEKNWRKYPYLVKSDTAPSDSNYFSTNKFEEWISRLNYIRVFAESDKNSQIMTENKFQSRLVPNSCALDLFKIMLHKEEKFTVLLNDVDVIDHNVVCIRNSLNIPYSWRQDDIVATYSTCGSGIGYHAGHEDAIIYQAKGRRHWKVWDHSEVDLELRKRIIISELHDIYSFPQPEAPPIFECILEEGDMLYIPPFFPHEGITLEESLSIAIGWKGITYFHLAQAFAKENIGSIDYRDKKFNWLFELVDDSVGGSYRDTNSIIKLISQRFHQYLKPNERELFTKKIATLMSVR